MGLLNQMTVKYGMDLTDLRAGYAEMKSLANDFLGVIGQATTALQTMSSSFNAGDLSAQVASASEEVAQLAESASLTGESLLQVGTEAEEMGGEVAGAAEEASGGLAGLGEATEKASGGMSGLFSKVGGFGSGLLDFGSKVGSTVFGLQAMGQAAVSMVGGVFSSAQQIEEATNSFEVFDGSMAKAKQEMSDLSSFAAHTPFETSAIDDAALKMQAVGISAKAVIPDIQSLGDALDAGGRVSTADLDMIVNDFDKIQTEGHLSTAVMNSFAIQGVDAWSILEKQTGKTHEQLAKYISKGLFPAKDAMADLTAGIEKSPLYSGQMANDTNSMTGIMSTLKSNWDQVVASFASPVMKDLEPILNGISNNLSSQGFKDFAGSVGQGIASAFGGIAGAAKNIDFKTIGDDVKKLGDWFKNSLQPALTQAEPGFSTLATTVGNLATSALPPLLDGLGMLIPQVVTLAGDIAGGLGAVLPPIIDNFQTWGPSILGVAMVLTAFFIPAIIATGVQSVINGTKTAVSFVTKIIQAGAAGWEAAGKLGSFIAQMVATGASAVAEGAKVAANWVAQTVAAGASAVADGARISANFVANMAKAGASAVLEGGKVAASWVANTVAAGASAVADGAKITANFVVSMVKAGVEAVTSGAKIAASFIANMVEAGASAVVAGAQIVASFIGSLIEAGIQAAVTGAAFVADLVPAILSMTADALVFAATAIPAILVGFAAWVVGAAAVAIANIAAFWPIYLVVAAIILIIGLVILAVKNWGAIAAWLQNAWKVISTFFEGLWNGIVKIFQGAAAWFHDYVWQPIVDRFTAVFNGLKDKAAGIWSSITGGVKAAFNDVINLINNGISGINNISSKVGIPAIPFLPHLSTGGFIEPGTWAVAGDPGPSSELVYGGKAGATVFSHGQSMAMAGGSGGGRGDTHVHVYMDSQEIAQYSASATADVVVKRIFGHGPVRSAAA